MTTNEVKKDRGRGGRERLSACFVCSVGLSSDWHFRNNQQHCIDYTRHGAREARERENTARTGEEAAMRRSMFDLIAMANVEGSRVIRCVLIRHSIKADSYLK